ncbi:hypothetical protein IQ255_11055 [Pleurocapsales cyanobacterium LEGE 10410]|nr:hypothetical protein [Pleurocapsales cyanobacterium LEGE 10410]
MDRAKPNPQLNQKGIYLVRCVPTGDTYIGSTNRSFRICWKEFRKQMRNFHNRRISLRIRNLWQAYGDEGFEFEVLEVTEPTPAKKHHYINLYSPSLNH